MKQILMAFQSNALTCLIIASAVGLSTSPAMADDTAPSQNEAAAKFEEMKSLAGTWKRSDLDSETFTIEFELLARDTVLVETWIVRGNPHSLSVFHLDNDTIMATHYCPQGNQPRLVLNEITDKGPLEFTFKDATNLPSFDRSHQHTLRLSLPTKTTPFVRSEMYMSAAGESWSEVELERIE